MMQKTRQRIVALLKRNSGLTTDELAEMLGISATAIRRHLKILEARNAVCHRAEQRGMGRPIYVYTLTNGASNLFPQSYTAFAKALLQDLKDFSGEEEPSELVDRRQKGRHRQYLALTKGQTLSDRVASLAQLMENEGRITTWQLINAQCFILREHNCPLFRLAREFDHPCRCEISLLKETLQASVKRVSHIAKGDVACVYVIEDQGNAKDRHIPPYPVERRHSIPAELLADQPSQPLTGSHPFTHAG